jgi:hypothetical protein
MIEPKVTFPKSANTPTNTALLFMFSKLSEASSNYFLQTFLKFVFIVGENIFFWETQTEYFQFRFISILKALVCLYLWQDIEIYRS